MERYPLPDEIAPARYFLDFINKPEYIAMIRIGLALIALTVVISYVLVVRKKTAKKGDK